MSCSHRAKTDEEGNNEACTPTREESHAERERVLFGNWGRLISLRFHDGCSSVFFCWRAAPLVAAAYGKDQHPLIRERSRCLPTSWNSPLEPRANSRNAGLLGPEVLMNIHLQMQKQPSAASARCLGHKKMKTLSMKNGISFQRWGRHGNCNNRLVGNHHIRSP